MEMKKKISRKDFLKLAGTAAASTVAAGLVEPDKIAAKADEEQQPAQADLSKLPREIVYKNELLRMQEDLLKALKKSRGMRRWAMVLDLRRCIGCSACTIGCKAENILPPGVVYRPVMDEEFGTYPKVTRRFTPRPCMQCDNPPCTSVCPVTATYKREDGIVVVDYNKCIGCRYCITACPYNARTADFGDTYTEGTPQVQDYELRPAFEYNKKWPRKRGLSPIGNARKCHFCIHRIEVGLLPACVTTCIGGATYFGDNFDTDSLVSELISRPNITTLKPELGTKPKVYYILG
ncbi:4Fe-4S dicluster domain-containing protein [bacterium]|nr:MAG: 4Fe-4S dicluster domain-containing protein [bacterium]